jgi:hypothetical protein
VGAPRGRQGDRSSKRSSSIASSQWGLFCSGTHGVAGRAHLTSLQRKARCLMVTTACSAGVAAWPGLARPSQCQGSRVRPLTSRRVRGPASRSPGSGAGTPSSRVRHRSELGRRAGTRGTRRVHRSGTGRCRPASDASRPHAHPLPCRPGHTPALDQDVRLSHTDEVTGRPALDAIPPCGLTPVLHCLRRVKIRLESRLARPHLRLTRTRRAPRGFRVSPRSTSTSCVRAGA